MYGNNFYTVVYTMSLKNLNSKTILFVKLVFINKNNRVDTQT